MEDLGYLMLRIFLPLLLAEVLGKTLKGFGMPEMAGFILAGIISVTTPAYTPGIFDTGMYAAIILTAVLTQMIAPPLIDRAYAKLKAGDGGCESLSTR